MISEGKNNISPSHTVRVDIISYAMSGRQDALLFVIVTWPSHAIGWLLFMTNEFQLLPFKPVLQLKVIQLLCFISKNISKAVNCFKENHCYIQM